MHRLLPALVLLLHLYCYGQIDQGKLDSLSKSIDSSAKAYKSLQDSFAKIQDSIYQAAISKDIQRNSRNLDNLAGQKRRDAKERQQAILRIVISLTLFIIGMVALLRRRKTKT